MKVVLLLHNSAFRIIGGLNSENDILFSEKAN